MVRNIKGYSFFLVLLPFCFLTETWATIFKLTPIEDQIREADGVVQGYFLKKKTIELENNRVTTQMIFKMTKEWGIDSARLGIDEIIVHYPGGKMKSRHVRVDGVPEFIPGENVVLFVRNVDNRFWGLNLGFGSFRLINYGEEKLLVNYIFPHHPLVGQVSYHKFEDLVRSLKGSGLEAVISSQILTKASKTFTGVSRQVEGDDLNKSKILFQQERQNRSVASEGNKRQNKTNKDELTLFWLIALFGFFGGVYKVIRTKSKRS